MKLREANQLSCHRRLLANLHSGHVYIWNYNDQTVVKSFQVTEAPGPPSPTRSLSLEALCPPATCRQSDGMAASPNV